MRWMRAPASRPRPKVSPQAPDVTRLGEVPPDSLPDQPPTELQLRVAFDLAPIDTLAAGASRGHFPC